MKVSLAMACVVLNFSIISMQVRVTMPSEAEIAKRLRKSSFGDFDRDSGIACQFGGQMFKLDEVVNIIAVLWGDYGKRCASDSSPNISVSQWLVDQERPKLFEILFPDHSEEIDEIFHESDLFAQDDAEKFEPIKRRHGRSCIVS